MLFLKPSEIRFSQDSINNLFDSKCNHSHKTIGETLDDICDHRCNVDDIPTLRVAYHEDNWVTADNRRLWVFRELERLGKCNQIQVRQVHYIPEAKLTSSNDGKSVRVRGNPGGNWHRKPKQAKQTMRSTSSPRSQVSQRDNITTANYGRSVNPSYYGGISHTIQPSYEPGYGNKTSPVYKQYDNERAQHNSNRTMVNTNAYVGRIGAMPDSPTRQQRIIQHGGISSGQSTRTPRETRTFGRTNQVIYPSSRSITSSNTRPYEERPAPQRLRSERQENPPYADFAAQSDTGCCVIL